MPFYIYLLLALAVATTGAYFRGRKKNHWISGWISQTLEEVLKPGDKDYVNIGGSIGYNFTYKLSRPFTHAKGTYTLLPRQSLLYLPLSWIIARYDRFYVNIFLKGKLPGEGHILRRDYIKKMRTTITGQEKMHREEIIHGGIVYVLLWNKPVMEKLMKDFLSRGVVGRDLLHFCCYRDNNTFFLHMQPRNPEDFKAGIKAFWKHLEIFLTLGVNDNGKSSQSHDAGDDPED